MFPRRPYAQTVQQQGDCSESEANRYGRGEHGRWDLAPRGAHGADYWTDLCWWQTRDGFESSGALTRATARVVMGAGENHEDNTRQEGRGAADRLLRLAGAGDRIS